jgi:Holliday junction DNA helicase RuvA
MIARLTGRLLHRTAEAVVIDVGGVGYEAAVPLSTSAALPEPGGDVTLHIHTHVREDALSLYAFATEIEKEAFRLLLGVSGIGPKLALSVLSGLSVNDLIAGIAAGDETKLSSIPGIGKKTAARLCLELKDKARVLAPGAAAAAPQAAAGKPENFGDAVSALVNLGYKRPPAEEAVQRAGRKLPGGRVEDLIREALADLAKR